MKIIVVGATGTIGSAVVNLLGKSHELIRVAHSSGQYRVDLGLKDSIRTLFETVGRFDAVVSTAGQARFGALAELSDEDYRVGLDNKLMGQVNLVRVGREFINDGGSFTLTSGVLAQHPMVGSTAISMVNAGLEGFVRAAALELPRWNIRVNVVSPVWVSETLKKLGRDPGQGMPADQVAKAYLESVESRRNGEVLAVKDFA
jgi:NAD(P)-dependent dehydrogenase (short-subunit alcohol dehydrogenase family)